MKDESKVIEGDELASVPASELEDFATEERCIRVAEILSLLANAKRLKILCLLTEGDHSVDEIVQAAGSSFSATSQQLKLLTLAGFLERRRDGRNIFYRLKDAKIYSVLHHLKSLYLDESGIPSAGAIKAIPAALHTKGA
ncbi:MAG TPA: metalloregulator ArsR/SmtB family transcription factor [Rectinemataceae bacterium]|nr:metalloregulator ArsR/SmtB family transcription factor [Rectinemataceae bacterium]